MEKEILIRYACCVPVKGYLRSIIYDFNRETYYFISNDLYHILCKYNRKAKIDVYNDYSEENHRILDEYFDFLDQNEIIFYALESEKKCFPELSRKFETSSIISNAIINVNNDTLTSDLSKVITILEGLLCEMLQLRVIKGFLSKETIYDIVNLFQNSTISNLECVFNYHDEYLNDDFFNQLAKIQNRISNIYVFDSPAFQVSNFTDRPYGKIIYLPKNKNKYDIVPDFFYVNLSLFCESLHFNNFFNKKIFIDEYYNIKNGLGTPQIFGNMLYADVLDIVNSVEYQYLWNIVTVHCRTYCRGDVVVVPLRVNYKYNKLCLPTNKITAPTTPSINRSV